MTPKEKAEELVDKYFKLLNYEFGDLVYSFKDKPPHKCALVAVDEILQVLQQGHPTDLVLIPMDMIDYWLEVKREIENP
jgi:hypothetical protein